MAMNFNSVLDTKLEDIKQPPLVPVGTYRGSVKKAPNINTSNDGKWEIVDFPIQLVEAQEDVDAEALATYGQLGPNAMTNKKFMFNTEDDAAFKRTEYDMRRFLIDHLQCATPDMSLKEAINASMGAQCLVFMKWTADEDNPELFYANAGKTAPVA